MDITKSQLDQSIFNAVRSATPAPQSRDQADREAIILAHLPQVELLARRLHRRCTQVELDDLIQAGTLGLIQAIDRFDESRGCLLKTLAEHRIRGALLDYLRQLDPLPRNIRRFQKQRDALIADAARRGVQLTGADLATKLGLSLKRFRSFERAVEAARHVSLEALGRAA